MNEIYIQCLIKYLEQITQLEKNILFLEDKNGLLDKINYINLFMYQYNIIHINENVVFRTKYEDIKHEKDGRYILVIKDKDIESKLLDFIKRAEQGKVISISTKLFLDSIEDNVKWHERINEYNIEDIKEKFSELVDYRKSIKKTYIKKEEVDKLVLSSLIEENAININDDVDCYLYYIDLLSIYADIDRLKFNTDIKQLICKVFINYSSLISNIIKNNKFENFDNLMWSALILDELKVISIDNLKKISEIDCQDILACESDLDEIVNYARKISKRRRRLYINNKDKFENIIYSSKINVYDNDKNYKSIIKEGNATYISIVESLKNLIKNINLEGAKKVYKYTLKDLKEFELIINDTIIYSADNINKIREKLSIIINLFKDIEYLEEKVEFMDPDYNSWNELYDKYLSNIQYIFSKIRYLDNYELIEEYRYNFIDKRINNILNKYREKFALMIEENYNNWILSDLSLSRPIFNSDIEKLLEVGENKTFIVIFDGMRYDAWNNIVQPYFKDILQLRNTEYKNSYSLLPSVTSISREVIFENIIKRNKDEVSIIKKSESMKNYNTLNEQLYLDKKINIVIFNMFDRDGHRAVEDFYVFYEKQRSVFEQTINNFISMIPDDANIIITSDHGLMRIDENINLRNDEKSIQVKPRHIRVNDEINMEGCININNYLLPYDNKGYFIGGGEKDFYSHGGASIEEIIVPLVISKSKICRKYKSSIGSDELLNPVQKENFKLDNNISLKLDFKLNKKERVIIKSLYEFKDTKITNRDIEKILNKKLGSSGLVDGLIGRLIKKLKKNGLDFIDVSSAGDLIIYRFNERRLNGGI